MPVNGGLVGRSARATHPDSEGVCGDPGSLVDDVLDGDSQVGDAPGNGRSRCGLRVISVSPSELRDTARTVADGDAEGDQPTVSSHAWQGK